ncbi:hypothetical protein B0H16DRAFT_1879477 [Mycena metata]|uniref:Uncharacterized protein n=1 Tax=Mycena metata TaxID=1033252 RepID=A0AAD7NVF5_9AGAR|nr:hypothetical protein B0H16DRAFT_1879477 [Mycena metata]
MRRRSQTQGRLAKLDSEREYMAAISDFEVLMNEKAEELSTLFDKTPGEVKKALRGKTSLADERAANLHSAQVWKYSLEVNENLAGPKRELSEMLDADGRYEDLTQEEQDALLAEFEESHGVKKSGTRLDNAAASRDVAAFTNRVNKELRLLQQRTGAIGFCVVARSDVNDTLEPACVGTEEAEKFFVQVLHTTNSQFAIKFDNYGVDREAIVGQGLRKCDALRRQTVSMIADGLERAVGKPTAMKYPQYDDIPSNYGVELVGWPKETEFVPPSVLASMERLRSLYDALVAGTCRWEKMSASRVEEHKAALSTKGKREKKERRDKGLTRDQGKKLKEDEEEKKKARTGQRRRTTRSQMTADELVVHLRTLNREKKRRARARKAGKVVPPPSRSRRKSQPGPVIESPEVSDTSDDENDGGDDEEEWVPVAEKGGRKRKAAEDDASEGEDERRKGKKKQAKKRKVAETTDSECSEPDEEGGNTNSKSRVRFRVGRAQPSDNSSSDDDAVHRLRSLPFAAQPSKKYQHAQMLAEQNRRRQDQQKRQSALRNALLNKANARIRRGRSDDRMTAKLSR